MQIVQVTLWMYAVALRRSLECVGRNWVVSFAPVAYGIGLSMIGTLVGPFGIVGGLIYSLAQAACISSGLFLIKNMVSAGRTDLQDFVSGFTVYLWEVIAIGFILWVPLWALRTALAGVPNGALIYFLIQLALYILLNAVPELIYQSRTSGLELIGASYSFIVENWIEWLAPNLGLFALGYVLLDFVGSLLYGMPGFVQLFLEAFVVGLSLTYFMTFRGFLFAGLYGTTRRSRIYRYQARRD
ncbi:MAG TPA: hypothetical protein VNN13_01830 [Methylomirabilota bacterium]|nr:hypothetical protein [Methylomirabilota bacterium]